jgi:hypothetical protein
MSYQGINKFIDSYSKNILDGGSVDSGILNFSRPYTFSLTSNYSLTSQNIFSHSFDTTIYPTSLGTATGFSLFCTSANSFSGYYYTTIMQLYNQRELESFNGLFALTTLTAALTASFSSVDKFNPYKADNEFNNLSISSFSASVTGLYIYCFDRSIYGDKIHDGTLQLILNGSNTALAYDTYSYNNVSVYSLTSNYNDSISSVTRFWVLPDNGKLVLWSSDQNIMNSFTGINVIKFRNSVAINNKTLNLHINPDEFNITENYTYYLNDYATGRAPETWFTTVGLYNPWNELIAVMKVQTPIKKGNVPITIKAILDLL